jgi:hypothetical protein
MPGIHVLAAEQNVDGGVKPGHDVEASRAYAGLRAVGMRPAKPSLAEERVFDAVRSFVENLARGSGGA